MCSMFCGQYGREIIFLDHAFPRIIRKRCQVLNALSEVVNPGWIPSSDCQGHVVIQLTSVIFERTRNADTMLQMFYVRQLGRELI